MKSQIISEDLDNHEKSREIHSLFDLFHLNNEEISQFFESKNPAFFDYIKSEIEQKGKSKQKRF